MTPFKVFLSATGVIAALSAAPGQAADLLRPLPQLEPLQPIGAPVTELGNGWYLRGDVGGTEYAKPKEDRAYSLAHGQDVPLTALKLRDTWSVGGGVGYQFNNWLRADVTGDYRGASRFRDYSSRTQFTQGYNLEQGNLETATVLLNGYVDLGSWWGFTPYVGAGVGIAQKTFSRFFSQTTCTGLPIAANPGNVSCGGDLAGPGVPSGPQEAVMRANKTSYDLAWALTGGVSYALIGGFSVDANYRYLNLGKGETGFDAYAQNTRLKDLQAHEVRVGFRYMID